MADTNRGIQVNPRLPGALHADLTTWAKDHGLSLTAAVLMAITLGARQLHRLDDITDPVLPVVADRVRLAHELQHLCGGLANGTRQ